MHIFHNTNFDFLRWRWHAIGLSLLVILAGVAVIATRGLQLGIEFSGGTSLIAEFRQPVSIDAVRQTLAANYPDGGQATINTYGDASRNQIMVRVPQVGQESGSALSTTAQQVEAALRKGNLGDFSIAGTEVVGPAVGEELTEKGFYAFILSLLAILAYIAFRFQFSFALGAVVATLHDVLVTVAFLAFFGYDITLNVIAAILTVTGYSTNDTIVIFDRVRENMRFTRGKSLYDTINIALNQTLSRTVITAGTAFLSALALFLFGGDVLRGFAFAMLIGIVTGTYSSVFVAAAIVMFWQRKKTLTVGEAVPAAAAAKRTKAQRKARAS
jgi:preprotein translocase subunit SecF